MIPVLDHWHIEPSSRCALKCPRCPRAEVPESLLNRQLTLDFFINQIGEEIVKRISKITFCGNDGDPIYCTEILEIIAWLKTVNSNLHLVIITNGSYKSPAWWAKLGKLLNEHDIVHWSLDGWDQESNEQYRVNCDWNSISDGIIAFREVNKSTYTVWATIAFRFNESDLGHIINLATQREFDLWQLTLSTKFGRNYDTYPVNDPLEPVNSNLISTEHRFHRRHVDLSHRLRPGEELKKLFAARAAALQDTEYSGVCLIGNKGVFLNSHGEFYPCCWVANRYEHNQPWIEHAQKYNLYNHTLEEVLNLPFWNEVFPRFDGYECITKCTKEKLCDDAHTTEW